MSRKSCPLPAEDIPLEHLKLMWAMDGEEEIAFEDRLAELAGEGWLSQKEGAFRMHPLVQDVVREKLAPDEENCAVLIESLSEIMQQSITFAYDFLGYAGSMVERIDNKTEPTARLLIDLSDAYKAVGNIQLAQESIWRSLEILKTIDAKYRLSIAYKRTGDLHQALRVTGVFVSWAILLKKSVFCLFTSASW